MLLNYVTQQETLLIRKQALSKREITNGKIFAPISRL